VIGAEPFCLSGAFEKPVVSGFEPLD